MPDAATTVVDAINQALRLEMARDPSVMVLGEDVGQLGGVFRATVGLKDAFGADRCVDTPLSEAGIMGVAVGLALAGWRPVCEMQYDAFSYPALDQVLCHVGRYRWRTGGRVSLPIVVRIPYGGGVGAPELHSESPEALYLQAAGVKVVVPARPADAKGLLRAAIRDPDPVVFLEPKRLYRAARGDVPGGDHVVELGEGRLARSGADVTVIAYGAMVELALRAAEELAPSVSCEVVDLRSLRPLDEELVLASVARTGRVIVVHEAARTCGVAAEVSALIAEKALWHLRAPIQRVTGYDVPYPYGSLEHDYLPSAERIASAALEATSH